MTFRLVTLSFLFLLGWPMPTSSGASVPLGPIAVKGTAAQHAQLLEAVQLFESTGMELPPVLVNWSGDKADCSGANGVFRHSNQSSTIWICSEFRSTLVHELAHAWTTANLTTEEENAYMDHEGLEYWNNAKADWADRGIEHSANLIRLNLVASVSYMSPVWQDRAVAFERLTGGHSPLGGCGVQIAQ
jgi:hypothetical protein